MTEFMDALTDHGRAQLYQIMKVLGMAYKPKPRKPLEVLGKIEDPQEIERIMSMPPGKDKTEEIGL
jgi:hypothetical protein